MADYNGLLDGHYYMYDLTWLVKKITSFEAELNAAIDLKTIHYADPIQWNITTQYAPNTVVVDPNTGTAYMSKVPVPAGILLTNTDYWVAIFNYQRIYDKIMAGVAFNDRDNLTASKDLKMHDLVWYTGDLYRCTRDIPQGTVYTPGVNLAPTTIADCLEYYYGRDRKATVDNDTLTVAGDYTVTAGDITRTAQHITDHATQDYTIDADGAYNAEIDGAVSIHAGGAYNLNAKAITMTSDNLIINAPQNKATVVFNDYTLNLHDLVPFAALPGNTDTEKFTAALQGSGVVLDRNIELTGISYTKTDQQFYVLGNGHTIKMSGAFKSSVRYGNNIFFDNCVFDGTGGGFFDLGVYTVNALYQLVFNECVFRGFTHDILSGEHAQGIRFNNCSFFKNTGWHVNVQRCDALVYSGCDTEAADNDTTGCIRVESNAVGLIVQNSIFESQAGTVFNLTQLNECLFRGLYLEGNGFNFSIFNSASSNSLFDSITCNLRSGDTALLHFYPGNGNAMLGTFELSNVLAYDGCLIDIHGDHNNQLMHFTSKNYRAKKEFVGVPYVGFTSSDTLHYETVRVSGHGANITYPVSSLKCYGHTMLNALVNKVSLSGAAIADAGHHVASIDNETITIYGSVSDTTDLDYDITVIYC